MNSYIKKIALAPLVALSLLASGTGLAQQSNYPAASVVGPKVSADQIARDSANNATRATPQITVTPPAASCSASTVNWTSGAASCSAAYAGGASGTTASVTDSTGPDTGSATVSCTNGSATASGSCTGGVSCPSQLLSWSVSGNSCSATPASVASGNNVSLSSTNGTTGSAVFDCNNGTFSQRAGATCGSTSCAAQTVNWTVGADSCSAAYGGGSSGSSSSITDSTGPSTGSATATCNSGTVTTSGASCTTAAAQCASGVKTWTVGANTCSASMPTQNSGATITLMDVIDPVIGQADFACNNGTTTTSNASCWVNGGTAACAAQTVNWSVGASSCSASYAGGAHGSNLAVTDSAAPVTGSATVTCSDGAVSVTPGSCATTSASCSAQTVNWTVGANSCSASYGGGAHGASGTLTDSSAPATGTVTATCNNGTVSTSGASCSVATSCSAGQSLSWLVGALRCYGTSTSTTSGNTISVSTTSGNSGTATYMCNSDGSFSVSGSPTCSPLCSGGGGTGCGSVATGTSWQVGGVNCSLNSSTSPMADGCVAQAVDEDGVYQGQATLSCSNGALSLINSSCMAVSGAQPACTSTGATLTWTVGGAMCASPPVNADHGAIIGFVDNNTGSDGGGPGTTGNRGFRCNAGSWVDQGGGSCASTAVMCPAVNPQYWSGTNCVASLPSRAAGTVEPLVNTSSTHTGNAEFTCTAAGTWTLGTNTCTANPVGCPAISTTQWWDHNTACGAPGDTSTCCTVPNLPSMTHGQINSRVDDTSTGRTGYAIMSCTNGTRNYDTLYCPPLGCPALGQQWWANNGPCGSPGDTNNCCTVGSLAALSHGQQTTVYDSATGATGNAVTRCDNGNRTYPSLSCTPYVAPPPPPPTCSIPAYQYLESSVGCSVGTDNWNASLTLTQGSSGYLTFYNTTTRMNATCTTPGAGAPYFGFTLGAWNPCN